MKAAAYLAVLLFALPATSGEPITFGSSFKDGPILFAEDRELHIAWETSHQLDAARYSTGRVVAPSRAESIIYPDGSRRTRQAVCFGSGVYLGDRLFLTCAHTFREAASIKVAIGGNLVPATWTHGYEGLENHIDLALLELATEPSVPPVPIAERNPQIGETIHALGFGQNKYLHLRTGRVIRPTRVSNSESFETSAQVVSGDSGGPLVNDAGQLVGIITNNDNRFGYGNSFTVSNWEIRRFLQRTGCFPRIRAAVRGTVQRIGQTGVALSGGYSAVQAPSCPGGNCDRPARSAGGWRPVHPAPPGRYPGAVTRPAPPLGIDEPQTRLRPLDPSKAIQGDPEYSSGRAGSAAGTGSGGSVTAVDHQPIDTSQFVTRKQFDKAMATLGESIASVSVPDLSSFAKQSDVATKDDISGLTKTFDTYTTAANSELSALSKKIEQTLGVANASLDKHNALSLIVQNQRKDHTTLSQSINQRLPDIINQIQQKPSRSLLIPWTTALAGSSPIGIGLLVLGYLLRRRSGGSGSTNFRLTELMEALTPRIQQLMSPQATTPTMPRTTAETTRTVEETKQELHPAMTSNRAT